MHEDGDEDDQRDRNPDQPEKKSAPKAHVVRLLFGKATTRRAERRSDAGTGLFLRRTGTNSAERVRNSRHGALLVAVIGRLSEKAMMRGFSCAASFSFTKS
jgi:hypothetical protein